MLTLICFCSKSIKAYPAFILSTFGEYRNNLNNYPLIYMKKIAESVDWFEFFSYALIMTAPCIYFLLPALILSFKVLHCKGYYRETIGVDIGIKDILYEDNIVDSTVQSTKIACMTRCKGVSVTCYNFGYNEESGLCHLYDVQAMAGQTKPQQGWIYAAMGGKKCIIDVN